MKITKTQLTKMIREAVRAHVGYDPPLQRSERLVDRTSDRALVRLVQGDVNGARDLIMQVPPRAGRDATLNSVLQRAAGAGVDEDTEERLYQAVMTAIDELD